jgi:hypothetical protein
MSGRRSSRRGQRSGSGSSGAPAPGGRVVSPDSLAGYVDTSDDDDEEAGGGAPVQRQRVAPLTPPQAGRPTNPNNITSPDADSLAGETPI